MPAVNSRPVPAVSLPREAAAKKETSLMTRCKQWFRPMSSQQAELLAAAADAKQEDHAKSADFLPSSESWEDYLIEAGAHRIGTAF